MDGDQNVPWRHIIIYCILAYVLFWLPFFGVTLAGNDPGVWRTVFGIMGPYSPLIAAVLTRTLVAREGFRDAHLGVRGVVWRYWGFALLLPFFWNGVQDVLHFVLGFAALNWTKVPTGLYRVPINLFGGLIIFIGEEFGWRSYLLQKLLPLSRWNALLLSGAIWSLWHAPLVIIPNTSTPYRVQMSLAGSLLALLIFVLNGFIFGWLYIESKSVWPCVLMHSYNNLISFKLLREAWTVSAEPTLLQNTLMAIGPIVLVWLILYWKGSFRRETSK